MHNTTATTTCQCSPPQLYQHYQQHYHHYSSSPPPAPQLSEAIEAASEESQNLDAGEDEIELFPSNGAWFKKRKAGGNIGARNRLKARNRY